MSSRLAGDELFDGIAQDDRGRRDALLSGHLSGGHVSQRTERSMTDPAKSKRRRLRDAIVQEIGEDHPNALSRLDRLDGVGGAR